MLAGLSRRTATVLLIGVVFILIVGTLGNVYGGGPMFVFMVVSGAVSLYALGLVVVAVLGALISIVTYKGEEEPVKTFYIPVSIERPVPDTKIQTWGFEVLLAETPSYTLKRLFYQAGKAGGLQFHTTKDESFYLESGTAWVDFDNGAGKLVFIQMMTGMTFRIPAGAVHRFRAITDCVVFEASTNVKNDRVRMEKWYDQPEVEGLPSTHPEPTRNENDPALPAGSSREGKVGS